jgi:ABC-type transport system substrate-binding protein
MWCVGFTLNDKSACNDERVREALSISIDRDTIAKALYRGQAVPSGGWYGGPGSFGYPTDMPLPAYDPDKATKLLADAGYGPGNPLKVQITAYDDDVDFPMMPTLAEAIVGYYTAIGIDATIVTSDWQAQKDLLVKGKYTGQPNNPDVSPVTLFLRGMDNRYYFPAEQIGAYTKNGRLGAALWDNSKLPQQDTMLQAVTDSFDLPTQEKLFGDYYKWMEANFNHIPLLASSTVFGVSDKIKDWQPVAGKPFIHNLRTLVPAN